MLPDVTDKKRVSDLGTWLPAGSLTEEPSMASRAVDELQGKPNFHPHGVRLSV